MALGGNYDQVSDKIIIALHIVKQFLQICREGHFGVVIRLLRLQITNVTNQTIVLTKNIQCLTRPIEGSANIGSDLVDPEAIDDIHFITDKSCRFVIHQAAYDQKKNNYSGQRKQQQKIPEPQGRLHSILTRMR
ncbi:hypothetical protein D3C73_1014220 [compost metagenome]